MEKKKLYILWTNADRYTSHYMVMMYATNSMAKGWWEKVTVIIWGATAKYAAENDTIRERICFAMEAGVEFSACSSCANQLNATAALEELGVEVKPWGEPLTRVLKEDEALITV